MCERERERERDICIRLRGQNLCPAIVMRDRIQHSHENRSVCAHETERMRKKGRNPIKSLKIVE